MLTRAHTLCAPSNWPSVIVRIFARATTYNNIFLGNPISRHSCIYFIDKIIAMSPCRTFFFAPFKQSSFAFFPPWLEILPISGNAYFASFFMCMDIYKRVSFWYFIRFIIDTSQIANDSGNATMPFDQIFSSQRLGLILSQPDNVVNTTRQRRGKNKRKITLETTTKIDPWSVKSMGESDESRSIWVCFA